MSGKRAEHDSATPRMMGRVAERNTYQIPAKAPVSVHNHEEACGNAPERSNSVARELWAFTPRWHELCGACPWPDDAQEVLETHYAGGPDSPDGRYAYR